MSGYRTLLLGVLTVAATAAVESLLSSQNVLQELIHNPFVFSIVISVLFVAKRYLAPTTTTATVIDKALGK